jgi:hypothetical protein
MGDKRIRRRTEDHFGNQCWQLPPLILHPFAENQSPEKLLEASRAGLMLHGILPNDDNSEDELARRLLDGRICEIRMLYFVGKDLCRWISQCLEFSQRTPALERAGLKEQSFGVLLIENPPAAVQDKLRKWGVRDFRAIFGRAIALDAVFCQPPSPEHLSTAFIRNYYRYADQLYCCWQSLTPFTEIGSENFGFELYASAEYARLLEREWEAG